MNSDRVSVVLASYNGEKYINEQLRTICNQTVVPNEIVISDDGSTDDTFQIVDKYCENKKEIHLVLTINQGKHGFVYNFENALRLATGDFVFLADQDDVWESEKVEKVLQVFRRYPDAVLVIHRNENIDSSGRVVVDTKQDYIVDSIVSDTSCPLDDEDCSIYKVKRKTWLHKAIYKCLARGMSMCFRVDFIKSLIPFSDKCLHHDMYLPFVALLNDSVYYIDEPLAYHRFHTDNVTGTVSREKSLINKIRVERRLKESIRLNGNKIRYYKGMKDAIEEYKRVNDCDKTPREIVETYNSVCSGLIVAEEQARIFRMSRWASLMDILKLSITTHCYKHNLRVLIIDIIALISYSKSQRQRIIDNS